MAAQTIVMGSASTIAETQPVHADASREGRCPAGKGSRKATGCPSPESHRRSACTVPFTRMLGAQVLHSVRVLLGEMCTAALQAVHSRSFLAFGAKTTAPALQGSLKRCSLRCWAAEPPSLSLSLPACAAQTCIRSQVLSLTISALQSVFLVAITCALRLQA